MVRFRVSVHQARDEHLVEAHVPGCSNEDSALIAAFKSGCAAAEFARFMNDLSAQRDARRRELKYGDD